MIILIGFVNSKSIFQRFFFDYETLCDTCLGWFKGSGHDDHEVVVGQDWIEYVLLEHNNIRVYPGLANTIFDSTKFFRMPYHWLNTEVKAIVSSLIEVSNLLMNRLDNYFVKRMISEQL